MTYIFHDYTAKLDYRKILQKYFSNKGHRLVFPKKKFIECTYRKLDVVYLIVRGKIKQYFLDNDGTERTILVLSKGDMFGEITLIQGDSDRVISETLEETEVIRIAKKDFFDTLDNKEVYNALLEMITTKFRIIMAQLYDNTYCSARTRLINLLTRLSRQYGIKEANTIKIDIKLTHEEIANMIGSSRSTVTRLLNDLSKNNYIQLKNKYIYLNLKS